MAKHRPGKAVEAGGGWGGREGGAPWVPAIRGARSVENRMLVEPKVRFLPTPRCPSSPNHRYLGRAPPRAGVVPTERPPEAAKELQTPGVGQDVGEVPVGGRGGARAALGPPQEKPLPPGRHSGTIQWLSPSRSIQNRPPHSSPSPTRVPPSSRVSSAHAHPCLRVPQALSPPPGRWHPSTHELACPGAGGVPREAPGG